MNSYTFLWELRHPKNLGLKDTTLGILAPQIVTEPTTWLFHQLHSSPKAPKEMACL